jgi:hypothetical protein
MYFLRFRNDKPCNAETSAFGLITQFMLEFWMIEKFGGAFKFNRNRVMITVNHRGF